MGIVIFLMFSFRILTVSFIESKRFNNLNGYGRTIRREKM